MERASVERKGRASQAPQACRWRARDARNQALALGPQQRYTSRGRYPRADEHSARADPAGAGPEREGRFTPSGLASCPPQAARPRHHPRPRHGRRVSPAPSVRCWSRLRAHSLSGRRREGEAAGKEGLRPGCV